LYFTTELNKVQLQEQCYRVIFSVIRNAII
jgi:hypothetical protein